VRAGPGRRGGNHSTNANCDMQVEYWLVRTLRLAGARIVPADSAWIGPDRPRCPLCTQRCTFGIHRNVSFKSNETCSALVQMGGLETFKRSGSGSAAILCIECGSDLSLPPVAAESGFLLSNAAAGASSGGRGSIRESRQQPSKGAGNRVHQSRKFTITVASLVTLVGMVLCLLGTGLTQPATGAGPGQTPQMGAPGRPSASAGGAELPAPAPSPAAHKRKHHKHRRKHRLPEIPPVPPPSLM